MTTTTDEIRQSFNKQASVYEQASKVQHEIGERLFSRLDYLMIKPRYVLDLGSGPGQFTKALKKRYPKAEVIGFDLAYAMLQQAKKKQRWHCKWPLVAGDMTALPFASGVFDLIFANQVIHWSFPLVSGIREINRVMNKEGCLMFSTLGPDTFQELRHAWSLVHDFSHTNEFIDMHDLGDLLVAERFIDPVVDMEKLTVHYQQLTDLLQALKAQGVRNIHPKRNPGLTGKKTWQAFSKRMQASADSFIPLTYEVVYGHAWKGQQHAQGNGMETYVSTVIPVLK